MGTGPVSPGALLWFTASEKEEKYKETLSVKRANPGGYTAPLLTCTASLLKANISEDTWP